ncbi:MAG: hypothetical protein ACTSUV_05085 [Candidatus Ranarchaeia archaeon]
MVVLGTTIIRDEKLSIKIDKKGVKIDGWCLLKDKEDIQEKLASLPIGQKIMTNIKSKKKELLLKDIQQKETPPKGSHIKQNIWTFLITLE